MINKSRIASILKANNLDHSMTGFQTFKLSDLEIDPNIDLDFQIPTNLRLGHVAEKIVSELIKLSTNYKIIYENIQLLEDKVTIGEIDFIIEQRKTKQLIHMELAYKFYLLDPSISSKPIMNWIGPNRKDTLNEKLAKLKSKQFPLLYHNSSKSKFNALKLNKISQSLCFLASLFIPYGYSKTISPIYESAIRGYYLNMETFISINNSAKSYYIPPKIEWGIEPSENKNWTDIKGVEKIIQQCLKEKQAPLCWQKEKNSYLAFFIVWW